MYVLTFTPVRDMHGRTWRLFWGESRFVVGRNRPPRTVCDNSEGVRPFRQSNLIKHVPGGLLLLSQRSDVVAAAAYVGTLRAAIIAGNFDSE